MRIAAYMLSCQERAHLREQTLRDLAATDWDDEVTLVLDVGGPEEPRERSLRTCLRLLQKAVADRPDYLLVLEDDLSFNSHLKHNLTHWTPLNSAGEHFLGSLYNPSKAQRPEREEPFFVAHPYGVYGAQAVVLSVSTARYLVEHWDEVEGGQDIRMYRLAAQLGPIYYHVPSLAQHMGVRSNLGLPFHWSIDFDPQWKAGASAPARRAGAREEHSRRVLSTAAVGGRATSGAAASGLAVRWSAPLFDESGYAEEARNFVFALDRAGVAVTVNPMGWSTRGSPVPPRAAERLRQLQYRPVARPFVDVVHFMANFFQRHPDAFLNVGRTTFETDRLPALWVAQCNQMDEVWVPSSFNMESFARAGVAPEKLYRVPEPLDLDLYDPTVPLLPLEGVSGFVFISVFGWSLRKGWDILVRAYVEEFSADEDVTLLIRAVRPPDKTAADLRAEIERCVRDVLGRDPWSIPRIVLLDIDLAVEDMPRLYRAADCYVMPSRGEGWGRPYMEAMAMGLPTIGTRWGGSLDFMTDANAYLIDCALAEVPRAAWEETPQYRGHRWAEPSVQHLRTLMRRVVQGRREALLKGARARHDIVDRYSWDRVAAAVVERLSDAAPATPAAAPAARAVTVAWEGPQFIHYSLALVNRELCTELMRSGQVDLRLICDAPYDPAVWPDDRYAQLASRATSSGGGRVEVYVRHQWPPRFQPPADGRWVMIQPWEFGSLPRAWVEPMTRLVDEIWVPSTYVRDCYIQSGIEPSKVMVIPNGVDPERFHPQAAPLPLPTRRRFRFLYVGGTIARKGIDILLHTYLQTFHSGDDVCLVIKDCGAHSFYRDQTWRDHIRRLQHGVDSPEILYLSDDDLPDEAMPGLYTACDALVHPYRSEGFGLPILEAMACGLPVIVPRAGACLDYCDPTVCYFLPVRLAQARERRVDALETVGLPRWFEVDGMALARTMVRVMEHPDEARARGLRASAKVRRDFPWARAAEAAVERLYALASRPILRAGWRGSQAAPRATAGPRKNLSVCMIVRDEARRLADCLRSVQGLADEIVVVDTGSTDETVEVAKELGAQVYSFAWNDHWAEARNESLRHATRDWVLVLDADQTLDPDSQDEIRRLIQTDEPVGYLLRQINYLDPAGSVVEHLTLRLFPNHPDICFVGRIHEQVQARRPDLAFRVVPSGVVVHHHGYTSAVAEPREKAERDIPLLRQALAEEPDEPFHCYNLGVTYLVLGRFAEAEQQLRAVARCWAPSLASGVYPPYVVSAYVMLALALVQQEQDREAIEFCRQALTLAPDYSDAHCTLAGAEARLGHYEAALRAYERALACQDTPAYAPTDRATAGWKALLGLGEVSLALGRLTEARDYLERAAGLSPHNPDIEARLAELGPATS